MKQPVSLSLAGERSGFAIACRKGSAASLSLAAKGVQLRYRLLLIAYGSHPGG
jgi:hypothetical protein